MTTDSSEWGGRIIPGKFLYYIQAQLSLRKECMHVRAKKRPGNQSKISMSCLRSLSYHLPIMPWGYAASCTLCFEGEGGADLVGSLVELLGIKGGAKAEGHTGAEENVVGDGCDTAVVDLDLLAVSAYAHVDL
jgi:hypothetical protein